MKRACSLAVSIIYSAFFGARPHWGSGPAVAVSLAEPFRAEVDVERSGVGLASISLARLPEVPLSLAGLAG